MSYGNRLRSWVAPRLLFLLDYQSRCVAAKKLGEIEDNRA